MRRFLESFLLKTGKRRRSKTHHLEPEIVDFIQEFTSFLVDRSIHLILFPGCVFEEEKSKINCQRKSGKKVMRET